MNVYGTAQMGDELKWQGRTHYISTNPLEDYWADTASRPKFVLQKSFPFFGDVYWTNNWRGYKANYVIEDSLLYLTRIKGWIGNHRAKVSRLFPDDFKEGKVFCKWYTGVLRIRKGKVLKYIHMGYMASTEYEIEIGIENGRITSIDTLEPMITYGFPKIREIDLVRYKVSVPLGFTECYKEIGDSSCLAWDNLKMTLESKFVNSKMRRTLGEQERFIKSKLDSLINAENPNEWEIEQGKYRFGYRAIASQHLGDTSFAIVFVANIHSFLCMTIKQTGTTPMKFAQNVYLISKTIELDEYGY